MAKATKFETFDRDIQLATAGLAPEKIAAELARFARQELAGVLKRGEASPIYDTFVNGIRGAAEETVKAPGPILYQFSYWQPIIAFTLDYLQRRSPVKSGRYAASHMVMIGSQIIRPDATISADEEVTIVSDQPYSRKIEAGHMQMSVPRYVYADARKAVVARFGGAKGFIEVQATQVLLPNGYILKGRFRKGFRKYARTKLRKDTEAGARMTYPALIMKLKGT
ncbi:hypothetical protein V5F34_08465 [Xanthobacter autotrophicus]|uniref:hypothetical protein n=1 Tax=Xanthobacter autotrophicus TaxID=280 RepID=UPI0037267593